MSERPVNNPRSTARSTGNVLLLNVALSVMLVLAAAYTGPAGALIHVFWAVPVVMTGYVAGLMPASAVVVSTAVVQYYAAGLVPGLLYLAQFGVPAAILAASLRMQVGWPRAVCRATFLAAVLLGCMGGYAAMEAGSGIHELVSSYIDSEVDLVRNVYSEAGLDKQQLQDLLTVVENTADYIKRAYVGITLVALGLVNLVATAALYMFGRGKIVLPGVEFHRFKVHELLIWVLIAAGFGLLLPVNAVQDVGLNLLTVLLPVYFLQGIAIVTFYFRKKAFSLLARIFAYTIMLLVNPLPLMVTALGVFDLWFDFRKPRVKTT